MIYVALVTLLLLLQYTWFMIQVIKVRVDDDVEALQEEGNEKFERNNRIQLNTLEQLIITVPAMWVCAHYFRTDVAAILGLMFLIGRFIYASSFRKDPSKRVIGFMTGAIANLLLLVCALIGVLPKLL